MVHKKRKNLSPGSSSAKKRKSKKVDYEMETKFDKDLEEAIGKKNEGKNGIFTRNKMKS